MAQGRDLFVGKDARAGDKADPFRALKGKAGAAAGNHVDDQLAVGEEFVLLRPHPDRTTADVTKADIDPADLELTCRIAHRRAAIAAAARLMEHQRAMKPLQSLNDRSGRFGDDNPLDHACPPSASWEE